jgi:hypothetical protein
MLMPNANNLITSLNNTQFHIKNPFNVVADVRGHTVA